MTDILTKARDQAERAFLDLLNQGGFAISTNHEDGMHQLRLHFGRDDEKCKSLCIALLTYGKAAKTLYDSEMSTPEIERAAKLGGVNGV